MESPRRFEGVMGFSRLFFRLFSLALLGLAAACATTAPGEASHVSVTPKEMPPEDAKFYAFLKEFRRTALAQGIRAETYDAATANISINARIQTLNQEQPEFVKQVWDYLDTAASADRVGNGQAKLASYASVLASIETRYGVPKEVLVAIWGIESNYGQAMGGFNMFEALATLGYDGPRSDYARREFLAALTMMQQEHYSPAQMTSSWAGAFGQTQFVPSTFLTKAVDGDGDGKIDLWNSPADALASTARLLADAGWQRGQSWGYEVTLPKGFAYEDADPGNALSIGEWKKRGVKTVSGAEPPMAAGTAAIYLPGGARGPAFLLLPNFNVVLDYNNAASYALAVCILSDRLKGSAPIATPWPRDELPLSHDERIAFQTDLAALGYNVGTIDGVLGHQTRSALRQYQKARGYAADGFPTEDLLTHLAIEAKAKSH
jgi:membrane-bound lytic murein transglycosylase B